MLTLKDNKQDFEIPIKNTNLHEILDSIIEYYKTQ